MLAMRNEMKLAVEITVLAFAVVLAGGCSIITDKDRELAERITKDGAGCIYIQGSGGAATIVLPAPVVPGGGYGQGSLTAARSNNPDAKVTCGPDGAKVE